MSYRCYDVVQVFQLDSQYAAGADGARSADDNKSYVFLFYSPSPTSNATSSSSSSTAAASEDSVLIAR